MNSSVHVPPVRRHRPWFAVPLVAALAVTAVWGTQPASAAPAGDFPLPTVHTQRAHSPYANFTAKWTRADARQIAAQSNADVAPGENSLPKSQTMPTISGDFPDTNPDVWVWDTWTLTDSKADQISYKGWEVIFALTADRNAGYSFDDRHTHAKQGYFYRKAGIPAKKRPANGGWIYGGDVFPAGATASVFKGTTFTDQAEWSGSTRIFKDGTIRAFYTDLAFNRDANGQDITPAQAVITQSAGKIHANKKGVWFSGLKKQYPLLRPDGKWYQNGEQNQYYNFRDPFTFEDPKHPGKTFMVFEGNTAVTRGAKTCTAADLGYRDGDPAAESVESVNDSGATYQQANVGLAVADNRSLTKWHFLPPILSANCVTDQTERPQIYRKGGKYYLFTISHRSTYAAGVDGPDGVYGFVGNGIRSDFQPVNGSGLALGNPTDLNTPAGSPFNILADENPNAYQSYSHYVMPGGLVESFVDAVGPRRGGTLAPTVKLDIRGATTSVDRTYGTGGLGGYGDIPANKSFTRLTDRTPSTSGHVVRGRWR